MSLATSSGMAGGGGAAGGLTMAYQPNQVQQQMPQAPPEAAASSHGVPTTSYSLGADLVDKHQEISLKQVRNLAHLPIVAVDLYASEPVVALFPPKQKDVSEGVPPIQMGKTKANISLTSSETAHKTLRKYLAGSKTFDSLKADSLAQPKDKSAVVIEKPHRWLGLRRMEDAPSFVRSQVTEETSTPAIAEEASQSVGTTLANSTLDGSQPQGDDFDRVVCKVRLNASKKALTMLPEEAVQILLHQYQYQVAAKMKKEIDEETVDYPCAVALPAWACHDAAVEALKDATDSTGVFFQRSQCALAGALLPAVDGSSNPLLERLNLVRKKMLKDFQREQVEDPEAIFQDKILLILFGMTEEGFECTAVHVSTLNPGNISCLFGDFNVLSNVSTVSADPLSKMQSCSKDLEAAVDAIAPEADGPAGIVFYGSAAEQAKIRAKWEEIKSSQTEWKKVPGFPTKPNAVAMGTAVLGAVSHGRLTRWIKKAKGNDEEADLGIRVQNVAPVAVGVRMNYHGGAADKWTPVKTIFDFDRRVPAGPYAIDLVAAECVVHRNGGSSLSDDAFLKATKENEGAKGIPYREEAALNLKVQIVQKWTRDGEWKKVGDVMEPLVKTDVDEKKIACESVELQLSVGPTGMITTDLVGERESVVQATKTARNSAIRYWIILILSVLFFGGFLIRSYWEEYVFKRDTKRLLAYYKHVIPGSMADGDEQNARYLVWKYRSKKDRLWKTLEKKYGEPVLHVHEWEDEEDAEEENEETVNLDDGDEDDSDASGENAEQEEPDL